MSKIAERQLETETRAKKRHQRREEYCIKELNPIPCLSPLTEYNEGRQWPHTTQFFVIAIIIIFIIIEVCLSVDDRRRLKADCISLVSFISSSFFFFLRCPSLCSHSCFFSQAKGSRSLSCMKQPWFSQEKDRHDSCVEDTKRKRSPGEKKAGIRKIDWHEMTAGAVKLHKELTGETVKKKKPLDPQESVGQESIHPLSFIVQRRKRRAKRNQGHF